MAAKSDNAMSTLTPIEDSDEHSEKDTSSQVYSGHQFSQFRQQSLPRDDSEYKILLDQYSNALKGHKTENKHLKEALKQHKIK